MNNTIIQLHYNYTTFDVARDVTLHVLIAKSINNNSSNGNDL